MKSKWCKSAGIAAALGLSLSPALSQQTNQTHTLAELQEKLSAFVAQPRFDGALWGIKVISLDTFKTLFESHADRLMSPASCCKLYTGALALDRFGGDYRISTPIYATAKVSASGTVKGDLVVVGHGDATWNSRRFGTNFWDIFDPFVDALAKAGVRRVTGDIVADATYFKGTPVNSSLTVGDFQNGECPPISALSLNDGWNQVHVEPTSVGAPCRLTPVQPDAGLVLSNCTITVASNNPNHIEYYMPHGQNVIYVLGQSAVGMTNKDLDIPVLDPARWFAAALKDALARHGIKVKGHPRGIAWPQRSNFNTNQLVKIGEVQSPPLREVVKLYMKPSQNFEVDTLLTHVGETTRTAETPYWRDSEELGLMALRQFLVEDGLPADEVRFDEGSGLSEDNMATANSFVALLQHMSWNSEAKDFIDSLPIAGEDGTLRRRFHDTPAAGNIHAKTGTLHWVNSISGYVTSAAGEHLVFSLILNRYNPPPGEGSLKQLDTICLYLTEFAGRSIPGPEAVEQEYAPYGHLLLTQLTNAPFPHHARTEGRTYHGELYSAREHYSDSTVAIFVPKNFQPTDKVDFLVHFHGWRHTVAGTLDEYQLISQFAASGKNAVLIVPQGPYNSPDSFGGKLEDTNGFKNFMMEAVATLKGSGVLAQTNFEIGNIILSGHSGGYHVMAAILDHGGLSQNIRETWLFDALYGNTENFTAWQKRENGRLLDIYTDHGGTEGETSNLMATLKTNSVSFFFNEDTNATPPELQTNHLVFLHSDLVHNDVVAKRGTFREFLQTSCLGGTSSASP